MSPSPGDDFDTYGFVLGETKKQHGDGDGLREIQLDALKRWHAFQFELGKRSEESPLPLDFFLEIFDDYFFLGTLRPYTKVRLVDRTRRNLGWIGLTTSKRQYLIEGRREIQIKLKRLPDQLWTRDLVQDLLDTLLHEMTHAFLMLHSTPPRFLGITRYRSLVETEGLTGHGPCWLKVATAVQVEADRSLGEAWDKWELKIQRSRQFERNELKELNDRKGIQMMDEESD
ncbi:hypothetical protein IMSHALPRED_002765 [Imshaugia aleurites]|uniref:SprT-like domain-containing protein n=1 Tax=Imshaugia aleurites TaxID=172621 RepID=A0A8H3J6F2_9LECA|nr:hypothetical protein IMSHALPRED_002765 [Imshaugia aleurites]